MMDWIQGFLEHHDWINAFDHVWRRLPPYPGFVVPTKSYRMVSQWSGKEIRHFARVILGTFTVALRRTTKQPHPTGSQVQEFNTAMQCVHSITDFYLMTQYDSHTDKIVSYIQKYLREFYEMKGVFLRYRAGKGAKRAAAEAHKVLLKEQTETSVKGLTVSEKAKLPQEDALEHRNLMDEILREGAHYNFPKMHPISHYVEQIPKFSALKQYSTDISECMYKGFKETYQRSSKVNAISQMITNYTRDHIFIMKDLTIDVWNRIRQGEDSTADVGMGLQTQMYLRLQRKIDLRQVSNLEDLELRTALCGLKLATKIFLRQELQGSSADIARLSDTIRAYQVLEIPVPGFNGEDFVIHRARCTGVEGFRGGQGRSDWIWIIGSQKLVKNRPGGLNGCMVARLNALFKLGFKEEAYRLAYVTMLQCIGKAAVQGVEEMVRIRWPTVEQSLVVRIAQVEGMAYLIPLEPGESWLVNTRIDLQSWNKIYD